jgi:hypothetical protein
VSSPEQLAEGLVVVVPSAGGAHAVELRAPGLAPVAVFHAPNPALVREMAENIRRFVAAVLRAGPFTS